MQLQQLNLSYHPMEDRMVLSLNSTTGDVLQFYLTRRFIKAWLPKLSKALQVSSVGQATSESDVASQAIRDFEHEKAVSEANIKQSFSPAKPNEFPPDKTPTLILRGQIKSTDKEQVKILGLYPTEGLEGIEVRLDDKMLHSLYHLVQKVIQVAAWDITGDFNLAKPPPKSIN